MNTTTETTKFYSFSTGGQIAREVVNVAFCILLGYVIRKIVRNKTMDVRCKLFLGNLMMAHFLFWFSSLVRLPVVPYLTGIGCVVLVYITVILLYGTALAVVADTTDRFLSIRFPYHYAHISKRSVCVALLLLWGSAVLLTFGTLYGDINESQACAPWNTIPMHGMWLFGVVVTCSTSSVFIMSSYVMKEVLRHNRSIHNNSYALDRGFKRKARLIRKQLETTLTFITMSLSFCMMVVPLVIIFPLMDSGNYDDPTMIVLMTIFSVFSRVSDPFFYIFRRRILKSICCGCVPKINFDSHSITTTKQAETSNECQRNEDDTQNVPDEDLSRRTMGPIAPPVSSIGENRRQTEPELCRGHVEHTSSNGEYILETMYI